MTDESTLLRLKGIKETPNRILVYRQLRRAKGPLTMGELETRLATLDKSSIFRVLNLFVEHDVVHALSGVDGTMRYEICTGEHHCSLEDMHPHFYCTACQRIYCFEGMPMPAMVFPEGFSTKSVTYMAQGICKECAAANSESHD